MAERIVVTDPEAKALEDRCIRELNGFYPDHVIERAVVKDHKMLSERLSKARKLTGYETLADMLEAWGFTAAYKNGRPSTLDPEALLEELAKRYEGREKPGKFKDLIEQNPDLKGQIKTASNAAQKIWGKTFSAVLSERGIMTGIRRPPRKKASKDELDAMRDALLEKYRDAEEKPHALGILRTLHPEYAPYFDVTTARELEHLGILGGRAAKAKADAGAALASIKRLHEALADTPIIERPNSVSELCDMFPQEASCLKDYPAALTVRNALKNLGILKSGSEKLKKMSVRFCPAEDLVPLFKKTVGSSLVMPNDALANELPPFVLGVDLENDCELKRALVWMDDEDWLDQHRLSLPKPGSKVFLGVDSYGRPALFADEQRSRCLQLYWDRPDFFNGLIRQETETPLAEFTDATVTSTYGSNNEYAQVEVRYLTKLSTNTLLYVLRNHGLFTDGELAGDPFWRYRLGIEKLGGYSLSEVDDDPAALAHTAAGKPLPPTFVEQQCHQTPAYTFSEGASE